MIPKKPNTKEISEFRPINLHQVTLGNIFENIITKKINKWIEENNTSNQEQSGFRKNRSTIKPLFQFLPKKNR